MTVLECLERPDLFGTAFQHGDWSRWRAFLSAAYGLPMDAEALATYRECTGRQEPPVAPAREVYAVVGRRGGKSRVAAAIAAYAASQDYRDRLAPGEWATVAVIAADRSQAGIVFGYVRALVNDSPLLCRLVGRETADTLELKNRVRIEVTTASARTTRGYSFALIVADELCHWKSDESAEPDTEVIAAVRPGLATLGGIIVGISSPYSRRGVMWQQYRRHYGKDSATLIWRAPSLVMNPTLDPAIVQAALEEDEAAARAEYLAEWRSDLEAFVSREVIERCTVLGRAELPPTAGISYVGFLDASGGSRDSFTMAVAHGERRDGNVVAILDCVREVKPPLNPDAVVAEFAEVLRSYKLASATADKFAGVWVTDAFAKHSLHVVQNAEPKSVLYLGLLPLLNSERCELLDDRRLAAQLLGLERRTSRAGKDSVDHAPTGSDDRINSAAGALVLAADLVASDARPVLRARAGGVLTRRAGRIDWSQAP